jgi:hypothetical protein
MFYSFLRIDIKKPVPPRGGGPLFFEDGVLPRKAPCLFGENLSCFGRIYPLKKAVEGKWRIHIGGGARTMPNTAVSGDFLEDFTLSVLTTKPA